MKSSFTTNDHRVRQGCKSVGTVITDQGSKPKVLFRIAQMTAALSKLKTIWVIWRDKNISLSSKISLREIHGLPDGLGTLVRLRNLDIDSGHPEEIAGHWDEMLWKLLASHTKTTSLTMQSESKSGKPLGSIIITWRGKINRACPDNPARNSVRGGGGEGCKVCPSNNHHDYGIGEGAGAKLQVLFVLAQIKP